MKVFEACFLLMPLKKSLYLSVRPLIISFTFQNTSLPAKPKCRKVDVESTRTKSGRADITDEDGNPVEIEHVSVWDQISKKKCVEWFNFFTFDSYIIAKKGCHATFKVCYKEKKQTTTAAPLTTTPEPGKTIWGKNKKDTQYVSSYFSPK